MKKQRLTRKELAFNSTKGVPMANMNTAPTKIMQETSVIGTANHVQRNAGASWRGKSSWT
jgi:hypothetical protein